MIFAAYIRVLILFDFPPAGKSFDLKVLHSISEISSPTITECLTKNVRIDIGTP